MFKPFYRFFIPLLITLGLMACAPAQTATPVATPSRPPVLGTIDGVSGDLRYGGNMIVVGWAADMVRGTPVNGVEVVIDGRWTLPATIGDDRPDVVKLLGIPGVSKSGWSIQFSLGTLPPGRHNLGVLVYDNQNRPVLLALVYPFDIAPAASQATQSISSSIKPTETPQTNGAATSIVTPNAVATVTSVITNSTAITGNFDGIEGTARPGWVVIARGWAADTKTVGPAAQVDLLLDGKTVISSTPSVERADIAKDLGKPAYLKSGWIMRLPLSDTITVGKHKLKAMAMDAQGRSVVIGNEIEFEVLPVVAPAKPAVVAPKEATPVVKEAVKDAPKEPSKDAPKDAPKESTKDTPKEQATPKP